MIINEQVDVTGDLARYSWILTAPYKLREELHGWKWVRGKPGAYVCNDYALAVQTAGRFQLTITSNGSHAAHNRPMYKDCPVG